MTKELVSADEINLGDFQDILNAKMVYDEASGCLFDVWFDESCECQYAYVIWCGGGGGSSGGSSDESSGTGSSSTGETGDLGGTGNGGYGDGSEGYSGGGYSGSGGGGGSSGPNPESGRGSTVGILPSPLDLAIDNFFDNLTDEQEDCLNTNFSLRKQIRIYLENNMELVLEANGSPNTNPQDFVHLAIEEVCNGGEVDFDDKVILHSSVINNQKVKCVYDKLFNLTTSNISNNSNNVFNNIINNHFDSSKNSHIRFKITSTPNGEDAFTKGVTNNGISFFEIQLNPNVVDSASTIEIALMLIHESIHAELLDRCVQLGIINAFNSSGNPNFTNTSITYSTSEALFSILVYQYKNYGGTNTQWNHDLFTVLNYRTKMAQNLVNIHPWLKDTNNDFLTNVNNDNP